MDIVKGGGEDMMDVIDKIGIDYLFGSGSAILDNVALTLTDAWTWLPLYVALLVLIIRNNDSMRQIGVCFCFAVLCVAMASLMANAVVKPLVERPRPCNTPELMYLAQIAGDMHSKDFSFFSSHAANTMAVAVYFSLLVRSCGLSVTLLLWSLVNCWTRLYLGQHYLTDILVGMMWGVTSGVLSYILFLKVFRKISPSLNFVSSQYTRSGYSRPDIDTVLSVFILTVAYALIPNL